MSRLATLLACVTFVAAWLLPVDEYGTTLAEGGLPGWEAFRLSLSPILDRERDASPGSVIAVLSGLTNAWFLVGLAALTVWRKIPARVISWGSLAAALLNSTWWLTATSVRPIGAAPKWDPGSLRIGYYLWVASFLVLALAARMRSGSPGSEG